MGGVRFAHLIRLDEKGPTPYGQPLQRPYDVSGEHGRSRISVKVGLADCRQIQPDPRSTSGVPATLAIDSACTRLSVFFW